jgi:hypothetical protein
MSAPDNGYQMAFRRFEVADTCVFDRPPTGRMWFESVIRDHLDVGRPDQIARIFHRSVTSRTSGTFHTRVITRGVDPTLCGYYQSSRVQPYSRLHELGYIHLFPHTLVTARQRGEPISNQDGRCVPKRSSVIRMTSISAAVSVRRIGMPFGQLANPPTGVGVTPKRQTRSPLPTWPPFIR